MEFALYYAISAVHQQRQLERTLHGKLESCRRISGAVSHVAREVGAVVVAAQSQVEQTGRCTELDGRRQDRHAGTQLRAVAIPRHVRCRVAARRLARQPDVLRLAWVT